MSGQVQTSLDKSNFQTQLVQLDLEDLFECLETVEDGYGGMALVGAVEGLADLGGTGGGVNPGGGGKGRLKLDVFLLSPEHEDVGL